MESRYTEAGRFGKGSLGVLVSTFLLKNEV